MKRWAVCEIYPFDISSPWRPSSWLCSSTFDDDVGLVLSLTFFSSSSSPSLVSVNFVESRSGGGDDGGRDINKLRGADFGAAIFLNSYRPCSGQNKYRLGLDVRGLGRVTIRVSDEVFLGRMKSFGALDVCSAWAMSRRLNICVYHCTNYLVCIESVNGLYVPSSKERASIGIIEKFKRKWWCLMCGLL